MSGLFFDVKYGRAVEHVDAGEGDRRVFDVSDADDGDADRVRAARAACGENAGDGAGAALFDLEGGLVQQVEREDNEELHAGLDAEEGVFVLRQDVDLCGDVTAFRVEFRRVVAVFERGFDAADRGVGECFHF